MSFDPYLHFQGDCREAMTWYADVFGAQGIFLLSYAEASESADMPKSDSDRILHACVTLNGRMLLASDFPEGEAGGPQASVSVSHGCASRQEAEALFERLSEGGTPLMPFGDVFWADGFGMVRDRFGTHWMIGGPPKM